MPRAAGLVALVIGMAVRHERPGLTLFVATTVGIGPLILRDPRPAAVILGPMWWVVPARVLWEPAGTQAQGQMAGA